MNFELNDEQIALKDTVSRFVADRYGFEERRRKRLTAPHTDAQVWSEFAELGLLAVTVPEEKGGLGFSLNEAIIICQEFGKGLVVEPYVQMALLAARLLCAADNKMADALLAQVITGERLVTVALQESNLRYRFDQFATKIEATGNSYRLDGAKILVSGGDAADYLILPATLGATPALVLVPTQAAGVERHAFRQLDGSWACNVRFTSVELPPGAMLVQGDAASALLQSAFDEGALYTAAETIGCIDRIIEITAEYTGSRKQFGQPLSGFQVIQHRLAELFTEAEMARAALHGGMSGAAGSPEQRALAVSAARVRIDQAAQKIGNQGIHLHGGMGMTMEYSVGHFYRRLLMLSKAFGDAEYHLERYEQLSLKVT
jgi:alkylation response protein AidB-like acyl-CoA dehydrogenase